MKRRLNRARSDQLAISLRELPLSYPDIVVIICLSVLLCFVYLS